MANHTSADIVASSDSISAGYRNDTSGVQVYEAGENISAGNVVFVKLNDAKAYVSDLATQDDRRALGIALNTATSGNEVKVQTQGRYQTSGLTANTTYYLGNAGALTSTWNRVRVGYAVSTTELNISIEDERGSVGETRMFRTDLSCGGDLTAYWQLEDGTTISDGESPLDGNTVRDMNGNNEFPRAADTSGGTGGSTTHNHGMTAASQNIDVTGPAQSWFCPANTDNATNIQPPYVDHVFAICKK